MKIRFTPSQKGGVYSQPSGVSTERARPVKRSRGRGLKLLIALGLILAATAVTVIFFRTLKSPAQGTINQTPPSGAKKIETPYSQPGFYKGNYISFIYPAHYKQSPSKLSGNYLETVLYTSTDLTQEEITVGVYKGSLNTDGSVAYRQQHPELYRQNTSAQWLEFTKLDGTEDTFFIAHNGLIATVSAASPGKNLGTDALYVTSGLKWR